MDDVIQERADEDLIHALLGAMKQAAKAKDARGVIACFSGDATSFDLAPPLVQTKEALHDPAGLERWFATWADAGPNITTHQMTAHVAGDIAYAFGLQRMTGTRIGAPDSDLWFRSSFFLRREGGHWRIVHQHSSVPMSMDGENRALIDLTPEPDAD